MKSMTGFSVETLTKDKIEYKCILKSLNSRFLDVSIKSDNKTLEFIVISGLSILKNFSLQYI